jgi:hypothetical protein
MTLIVIELHGAAAGDLFAGGDLANLAYLASQGCAGDLTDAALWPHLAPHVERSLLLDGMQGTPEDALGLLRQAVEAGAHDYLHLTLTADTPSALRELDGALGFALEMLGPDDVLAVIAIAADHGGFLIASQNAPAGVQLGPAGAEDVAATMLALAGRPRPAALSGRLLIVDFAAPPDDEDDEAALRERFRGLGYIA